MERFINKYEDGIALGLGFVVACNLFYGVCDLAALIVSKVIK